MKKSHFVVISSICVLLALGTPRPASAWPVRAMTELVESFIRSFEKSAVKTDEALERALNSIDLNSPTSSTPSVYSPAANAGLRNIDLHSLTSEEDNDEQSDSDASMQEFDDMLEKLMEE